MTSLDELRANAVAKAFYEKTWREWYRDIQGTDPAQLVIHWDEVGNPGYRKDANEIHIYLNQSDLEDMDNEADGRGGWNGRCGFHTWKACLIHEMLHEFRYKGLKVSSEDGRRLMRTHDMPFDGDGHDELFYTAVVQKAEYFGVAPEDLLHDF